MEGDAEARAARNRVLMQELRQRHLELARRMVDIQEEVAAAFDRLGGSDPYRAAHWQGLADEARASAARSRETVRRAERSSPEPVDDPPTS